MGITPTRAAQISFGREYFPGDGQATGMFVGTHTFQNPIEGVIAVQSGTIHEDHLKARGARILGCDTAGAALAAVLDGRADTTFGSPDFLEPKVWHTSRTLTILGTEEISAGGAAPAFRKGDDALRHRFDAALDRLGGDGTLDRLRDTWFAPSRDI
jgi:ABC-type amino acid transport substrate-binding protein